MNMLSREDRAILIIFVLGILVWHIDDIMVGIAFYGLAFAIYSYRRLKENKEPDRRIEVERKLQQQLLRLRSLRAIDFDLMNDMTIPDILKTVIQYVPRELGGDVVAISVANESMFFARLPTGELVEENVLRVSEDMAEWFENQKEAITVYDLALKPQMQILSQKLQNMNFASYLGVPMVLQNRTIGAMHILTSDSKEFTKEDIEFFSMLAGQAAIAVDRSNAIEMLRKSEEKYRTIIETTNEGVWTLDATDKTSYVNSHMAHMLGYTQEEMLGKSFFDFMDASARIEAEKKMEILKTGTTETYDFRFSRKDGKDMWAIVSSNPLFDYMGLYVGALGMVTDITQRKYAQELRIDNEQLEIAFRTKSEFLASMSHELRTPLNAIMGFSDIMSMGIGGTLNETQKGYARDIYNAGQHLLLIIDDILDLSQAEAGKMELVIEKFSVNQLLEDTINLIKNKAIKHNIDINMDMDSQLEFIEGDKQKIKQVLLNLLSNAVKFSKEDNGVITIVVKMINGTVRFSVSDTGIGIEENKLNRLFKEFQQIDSGITRKYGGTGLGLVISKKIVELHGGKIWANSVYGKGSTFTFELPMQFSSNPPQPADAL